MKKITFLLLVSLVMVFPARSFAEEQHRTDWEKAWDGAVDMFGDTGAVPSGSFELPDADNFDTIGENTSLRGYILNVLNFALSFLGIIAVAMVIYAGFLYVTAGGDDTQQEKGKKIILYASIGIIVILASFALVNTLIKHAGRGTDDRVGHCGNGILEAGEHCEWGIWNEETNQVDGPHRLADMYKVENGGRGWPDSEYPVCPATCQLQWGGGGSGGTEDGGSLQIINTEISVFIDTNGNGNIDNGESLPKRPTTSLRPYEEGSLPEKRFTPFGGKVVVTREEAETGLGLKIETPSGIFKSTWNFGDGVQIDPVDDGNSDNGDELIFSRHQYFQEQTYRVNFIGYTGDALVRASVDIIVGGVTPNIRTSKTEPIVNENFELDGGNSRTAVGAISEYKWQCFWSEKINQNDDLSVQRDCFQGKLLSEDETDFGTTGKMVTAKFPTARKYKVQLVVNTNVGASASAEQVFSVIGDKPTALFRSEQSSDPLHPALYTFDANRSTNIEGRPVGLTYQWTFKEIDQSNVATVLLDAPQYGPSVKYEFKKKTGADPFPKKYVIELVVSQEYKGERIESAVTPQDVNVATTVGADFNTPLRPLVVGQEFAFIANSPEAGSFDWDFVDANVLDPETLQEVRAVFTTAGAHQVVLKVNPSENGADNTITKIVYAREEGEPLAIAKLTVTSAEGNAQEYSDGLVEVDRSDTLAFDDSLSVGANGEVGVPALLNKTWSVDGQTIGDAGGGGISDDIQNYIFATANKTYRIQLLVSEQGDPNTRDTAGFQIQVKNLSPVVTALEYPSGDNPVFGEGESVSNFPVRVTATDHESDTPFGGMVTQYKFEALERGLMKDVLLLDQPLAYFNLSQYQGEHRFNFRVTATDNESGIHTFTNSTDYFSFNNQGVNHLPTIQRILITNNRGLNRAVEGTTLNFQVQASDSDGDVLDYRWTVKDYQSGDILNQPVWGTDTTFSQIFATEGDYIVTVEAKDVREEDEARIVSIDQSVTIVTLESAEGINIPPRILRIETSPLQGPEGQTYHFFAEAEDPDGEANLGYTWSIRNLETFEIIPVERIQGIGTQNASFVSQVGDAGRYEAYVTVEELDDQEQGTGIKTESQPRQFSVLRLGERLNQPPRITRFDASSLQERVGTPFNFLVEATDPDGQASMRYEWKVVNLNTLSDIVIANDQRFTVSDNHLTFTPTVDDAGRYEVKVIVHELDENGAEVEGIQTESQPRTIQVLGLDASAPNQAPFIRRVDMSPSRGVVNTQFAFSVDTSDPEGDVLSYIWTVITPDLQRIDLNPQARNVVRAVYTPNTEGTYSVSVAVSDTAQNTVESERRQFVVVSVDQAGQINQSPRITRVNLSPIRGVVGTPFAFSVDAVDPEGGNLTYNWDIRKPDLTIVDPTGADTVRATYTPDVVGTYEVSVSVSDGTNTETQSRQFYVVEAGTPINQQPSIVRMNVTPNQGVQSAGTEFAFSVSATDPEDDELTYNWTIVTPNLQEVDATTGDTAVRGTYSPGENGILGTYEVYVTVRDTAQNEVSSQRRQFRLLSPNEVEQQNQSPRITRVNLSPIRGVVGTPFAFSVDAVDPEGGNLIYNWSIQTPDLQIVDIPDNEGGNTRRITYAPATIGTYEVIIEVGDGTNVVTERRQFYVVSAQQVNNQPPRIVRLDIAPTQGVRSADTEFAFSVSATDPEDDELTYNWTIVTPNLQEVDATTGDATTRATYSPGENGALGTYQVYVTITDTAVNTVTSERRTFRLISPNEAGQQNLPPRITQVNVSPMRGAVNTSFAFSVDAEDPESDEITYAWSIRTPDLQVNPVPDNEGGNTRRIVYTPATVGTYEAIITITAGEESVTQRRQFYAVSAQAPINQSPRVTRLSINPSQGRLGDQFFFYAEAQNPDAEDGDTLAYEWHVRNADTFEDITLENNLVQRFAYLSDTAGNYEVWVIVKEIRGQQELTRIESQHQYIRVLPVEAVINQPPRITRVVLTPQERVVDSEPFIFYAEATNPDGDDDNIRYKWEVLRPDLQNVELMNVVNSESRVTYDPVMNGAVDMLGVYQVQVIAYEVDNADVPIEGVETYSSPQIVRVISAEQQGQIPNQPPRISRFEVRPTQARRGEQVVLFTASTDPDGDDANLGYDWTLYDPNFTPLAVVGAGSRVTYTVPDDAPFGTYEAHVTVTDEDGASTDSFTRQFQVIADQVQPDQAPRITLLRVTPSQRIIGGDFLFEAQATDPEGDDMTYTWNVMNLNTFEIFRVQGERILHVPELVGDYEVWVTITSGENVIQSESRRIRVLAQEADINVPPSLGSILYSPVTIQAGVEILFRLSSATDPDGNNANMTYLWDFDDGSTADTDIARHTFATAGQYAVRVTVTDEDGMQTVSQPRIITVRPLVPENNQSPRIARLDIAPTQGVQNANTEFAFSVSATDPENEALTYNWTIVTPNLQEVDATTGDATTRATYTPGENGALGIYQAYVTITDTAQNIITSERKSFRLLTQNQAEEINQPPRITRVNLSPSRGVVNTAFAFSVDATDPENDEITYSWSIQQPDLQVVDIPDNEGGNTRRIIYTPVSLGTHEVIVTVTANEESVTQRRSFAVVSAQAQINQPPRITRLDIAPTQGVQSADTEFAFSVSATDPENEALTYNWTIVTPNLQEVDATTGDATTRATYTPGENGALGTYQVFATITDDSNNTVESQRRSFQLVAQNNVVVPNQPPRISRFEVRPTQARRGEQVVLFTASTDPDGDDVNLGYDWTLYDPNFTPLAVVGAGSRVTYTVPDDAPFGTYEAHVTVTDEDGASTDSFTRQFQVIADQVQPDQAPRITLLRVTPSQRIIGGDFLFEAQVMDADTAEENLSYVWSILNLQTFEVVTNNTRRVVYAPNTTGDYEVWVTVSDGVNAIQSEIRRIRVLEAEEDINVPPSIGNILYSPVNIEENTEILFRLSSATDPDGNNANMTYLWDFDDGSTADTDIARHTFATAGQYAVRVTVTDEDGMQTVSQPRVITVRALNNQPPNVGAVQAGGNRIAGERMLFAVTANDPDGDDASMSYLWTFSDGDQNVVFTREVEGVPWVSYTFEEAGPYALRVAVTDSGGATVTSRTYRVTINPAQ